MLEGPTRKASEQEPGKDLPRVEDRERLPAQMAAPSGMESPSEDVALESPESEEMTHQEWRAYVRKLAQRYERRLNYERSIRGPLLAEARRRREELLERRERLSLSREDFEQYFAGKPFEIHPRLKQTNTGNCYLVAALHALTRSPNYELMVRAGVRRLPDGSWVVRVPLLDPEGEECVITPKEITSQWNSGFLKRAEGKLLPDIRPVLRPTNTNEGLRVLEAAFMKKKFGSVDRRAAEGGHSAEIFEQMGGNVFVPRIAGAETGREGLDAALEPEQVKIDDVLNEFDPEIHIATAATKHFSSKTVEGAIVQSLQFYKGKGTHKVFVPGHAYSVSRVDKEAKQIALVNPWDTSKDIVLTFDQFKQNFNEIDSVRIHLGNLLRRVNAIAEPAS